MPKKKDEFTEMPAYMADLPDTTLIGKKDICESLSICGNTLWAMVKDGRFPPCDKLIRKNRQEWTVGRLRAWISGKRDFPEPKEIKFFYSNSAIDRRRDRESRRKLCAAG